MKDNKLDLKVIRASSNEASKRIKQLPKWMQEAILVVSHAAASEAYRDKHIQKLYKYDKDSN